MGNVGLSIGFSIYWAKRKAPVCACCEEIIIGDVYYPVVSVEGQQQTEDSKSNINLCTPCYLEMKKNESEQQ